MIRLQNLEIPLTVITKGAKLICLEVAPTFSYENGKRTDSQIGTTYTVVETQNFEKFKVKVANLTPVLTQEQIDSSKERVYLTFENAIAKPYRTQSGEYDLSISATNVVLAKQ